MNQTSNQVNELKTEPSDPTVRIASRIPSVKSRAHCVDIERRMFTWPRAPDKESGDTLVLMFGMRRLKKLLAHQVHSDGASSRLLLPSASQRNLINATRWVVRPVTFGIAATCALVRPDDRIPSVTSRW